MAGRSGRLAFEVAWRDEGDGRVSFWLELDHVPVSRCVVRFLRRADDSLHGHALMAWRELMNDAVYTRVGDYSGNMSGV